MSELAIKAENLGKLFHIGEGGAGKYRYQSLREVLSHPFRRHSPSTTDTIWALKDLSFEIQQGEVIGIIGRNGAGKSTLLKILSRITEPTEGSADVYGRVASLLEVGTGFHPELTGRENIYLNGAILGMRRAEIQRKFDEIVAFAEVEKFIDTPVKHYSSGMHVRLAFAVAAHLEPEILLIDEVLAVGDASFQKKCLGKMGAVAKEGRTVLFVSHNMQAVSSLCNLAVLIDQGRMVQFAEASTVVSSYLEQASAFLSTTRDQVWDDPQTAPGNGQIRLHRIRLLADTDRPMQELHMDTAIRLVIEYWNLAPNTQVALNFSLYGIDGSGVLEDWTADEATWGRRAFPNGLFRTVCRIPANLLNEGCYRVRILFFDLESTKHLYNHEEAVSFCVNDMGERTVSWHGKFIGFVHPKLTWTTELLRAEP